MEKRHPNHVAAYLLAIRRRKKDARIGHGGVRGDSSVGIHVVAPRHSRDRGTGHQRLFHDVSSLFDGSVSFPGLGRPHLRLFSVSTIPLCGHKQMCPQRRSSSTIHTLYRRSEFDAYINSRDLLLLPSHDDERSCSTARGRNCTEPQSAQDRESARRRGVPGEKSRTAR